MGRTSLRLQMPDDEGVEMDFEFIAEGGNIKAEIVADGVTIRFMASPYKMRWVANAILKAADEADTDMPRMS